MTSSGEIRPVSELNLPSPEEQRRRVYNSLPRLGIILRLMRPWYNTLGMPVSCLEEDINEFIPHFLHFFLWHVTLNNIPWNGCDKNQWRQDTTDLIFEWIQEATTICHVENVDRECFSKVSRILPEYAKEAFQSGIEILNKQLEFEKMETEDLRALLFQNLNNE